MTLVLPLACFVVLLTTGYRSWLRRKETVCAALTFLLVISPTCSGMGVAVVLVWLHSVGPIICLESEASVLTRNHLCYLDAMQSLLSIGC